MTTELNIDPRILKNYRLNDDGELEKCCTACHNWYERSGFHKHTRSSDGLQSWCKICLNQARGATRETHGQRIAREIRQLARLRAVTRLHSEMAFRKLAHRLYTARVSYVVTHPSGTFCQVELKLPQAIGGFTFTSVSQLAEYIEKANQ